MAVAIMQHIRSTMSEHFILSQSNIKITKIGKQKAPNIARESKHPLILVFIIIDLKYFYLTNRTE